LKPFLVLIGSVTVCLGVGMLGSVATRPNLEPWYAKLRKPPLTPPDAIFGPTWGVLFILMGVALTLLLLAPSSPLRSLALGLFGLQLALNSAWSWTFFGAHSPGWALVEIVPFLSAVAATAWTAGQVSQTAGLLLAPYVAWVTFATYLNAGIWALNRG